MRLKEEQKLNRMKFVISTYFQISRKPKPNLLQFV